MERKSYSISTLNKYVNEGRLEKNSHPSLPIAIYNYTRDTQFKNDWDDITLAMRGTIIDDKGYVVASAFPKFFKAVCKSFSWILPTIPSRSFSSCTVTGRVGTEFAFFLPIMLVC